MKFFKKERVILLILFILSSLSGRDEYYSNKIIIYIENNATDFQIKSDLKTTSISDLNNFFDKNGVRLIRKWLPNARSNDRNEDIYLNRYYVVEFEEIKNDLDRIIYDVMSIDEIRISEKIPITEPAYVPNDSLWDQLYGLEQVRAHLAYDLWDIESGEIPGQMDGGEVVVAIPDIGLKWDHPDLIDNIWQNLGEDADGDGVVLELINDEWVFDPDDVNGIDDDDDGYIDNFVGYDVAMADNDPMPLRLNHVHGTKVAGNVSAMTNNEIGLASVGYSVKLMGVNANNNVDEPWYLTHTNQAVLASAQMGADIINCSWVYGYSEATYNLFQTVYNQYGCITLGAAGNGVYNGGVSDTTDFNPRYPAAYENVISVTALGDNNSFNCWANVHETVDIGAPGEFIICAMPSQDEPYALGTGTSYATPLTAGAVALVKSMIPDADNETIIAKVIQTAEYYPDMDGSCSGQELDGLLGSGQLNIYRAILACSYPELLLAEINYQTDDGFINPGDTIVVDVTISNSLGFEVAENVVVTLSTSIPDLNIISGQIIFTDILSAGEELMGQFVFTSDDNAPIGEIPCNIHFSATSGEFSYENNVEIEVPLSLGQLGYPIEDINITRSPIITDLDGNNLSEIYFGSDSLLHGTWINGLDVIGFPFTGNSEILSSPAAGDLDGDGDKELVFGSSSGILYGITKTGTLHLSYEQSDPIIGSPVLSDMDHDGDLEIIFSSSNDSNSILYAIHDTGDDVPGFPVVISARMIVGPAVADIDNDMVLDIVIVTSDSNIIVIDGTGAIKNGFPFSTSASHSSPATLVDLDGDQDLEIILGSDDNDLLVIHHDNSFLNSFLDISGVRGGVSLSDIDGNGSLELLFTADDDHLYAWDPITNIMPAGWPINIGSRSISEPLTADLDNDGDLEVILSTISGSVHVLHHDGTYYENFPFTSQDSIVSTPAIGDLDNDGDYELIIGTLDGLHVMDIQGELGERYSWKMDRGNEYRNGYFDVTLASTKDKQNAIPSEFSLGTNYPNPFNPITKIRYRLPHEIRVILKIYDVNGREVKTLVNSNQSAGYRYTLWNGINNLGEPVTSGLYFYRIEAGSFSSTKKMIFLK